MTVHRDSSNSTNCYSEFEAVKLYHKSACQCFDGAAKAVFSEEGHIPELVSGKGTILFSINSIYVKQKSNPIRGKGLSIAHKLPAKSGKLGSDDDWTEVRAKPSKSNSPVSAAVDVFPPVSSIAPSINLFSQAPESFFHDEDSPVSSHMASPAATVKLHSDLSMNAPSFTPMSEDRRVLTEPVGFLDALRTHISTHSSGDAVAPIDTPPLRWTYLDPNGAPQGPFTGEQMAGWLAAGYFPPDLPVSWSGNGGLFGPLDKVYPGGSQSAFLSSPSDIGLVKPEAVSARTVASEAPARASAASPPRTRGWLWSPEEDVKLEAAAVASLSEIMNTEAKRKAK